MFNRKYNNNYNIILVVMGLKGRQNIIIIQGLIFKSFALRSLYALAHSTRNKQTIIILIIIIYFDNLLITLIRAPFSSFNRTFSFRRASNC